MLIRDMLDLGPEVYPPLKWTLGRLDALMLCGEEHREEPREESVLYGEEPREAYTARERVVWGGAQGGAQGAERGCCMCVDDSVNVLVYVMRCVCGVCG